MDNQTFELWMRIIEPILRDIRSDLRRLVEFERDKQLGYEDSSCKFRFKYKGYQPTESILDENDPPQEGSGVE